MTVIAVITVFIAVITVFIAVIVCFLRNGVGTDSDEEIEKVEQVKKSIQQDRENPDELQFNIKGFLCTLKRQKGLYWCSYVDIPNSHLLGDIKFWQIPSNDEQAKLMTELTDPPMMGVTFVDEHLDGNFIVVGFDCAHCTDVIPFRDSFRDEEIEGILKYGRTYKTVPWIKEQLTIFVQQLIELDASYWVKHIDSWEHLLPQDLIRVIVSYLTWEKSYLHMEWEKLELQSYDDAHQRM